MTQTFFQSSKALIGCYDVSNPSTLENLKDIFNEALKQYGQKALENLQIYLVATKSDKKNLCDDSVIAELKDDVGDFNHYITSAKTGENVAELFIDIAQSIKS